MQLHKTILTAILGVLLFPLTSWAQPGRQPNIIFLLADDHRYDALGAAGNTIIRTPHLDRLAREGVYFKNAYVTTAICSVSRASILSGQYLSRHGIDDFAKDFSPGALAHTYPLLLKKAGYTIGFAGKYGVGANPPETEFDYWKCVNKGQPPYWYKRADGSLIHDTDTVANSVADFLAHFAGKGPFCLSVSFKAPHELDGNPPLYPVQKRFETLYSDTQIPLPATYGPEYWEKHPAFFRTDENIGRVRWKPLFSTPERYQETAKNYYRLVTGVDEVAGKIRQQLEALGIAGNTIIVYMGDNGFCLGEHGLQGKWFGFEESIRVPLIIYDPRAAAPPHTEEKIALNIDIAPTLLDLAGLRAPGVMQGKSLAPFLSGRRVKSWRDDFFYEHTFLGTPRLPKTAGVVKTDWKYIMYTEHGYEEFYDLRRDPHETRNLADDPEYSKKLEAFRKRYLAYSKQVKD
ncbi:sulfatase [Ravibacter arvi]|uniref:Sulfatase n=1 Tax=Ravibacter arvi TaxID=2051041 RepID=A0ABP8LY72_9BACT